MRQLVILTQPEKYAFGSTLTLVPKAAHFPHTIAFSNAKTLLGHEYPYAIYDMRAEFGVCFHLEAFAILAGTIQQGGKLILLCPQWHNLTNELDQDALRWNGQHAIATPNFYRHLQQLVAHYQFEIDPPHLALTSGSISATFCKFTPQQQQIFDELPRHNAEIHLITAPRGRGKSTLAGKLAQQIAQTEKVLITAKSPTALANFHPHGAILPFFAPDQLISLIQQQQIARDNWLFIDEAAALPLPMLHALCAHFRKVVLTTTTQNYEGTGRGFSLKFLPQLTRPAHHWQLTTPLRWKENDPLEQFVTDLLLLDDKPQNELRHAIYQLLALAHYKTSATDLRRLLDAPHQHFFTHIEQHKLLAAAWLVDEGGIDHDLAHAIWHGERRPHGNLVAQYLCFQSGLVDACLLRSRRISRIAVEPTRQGQGIGKRLVSEIILQNQRENNIDFLSVSFGLTNALYQFWQCAGFRLVQLSQKPEASSGYFSAMMLLPLSEQGNALVQRAEQQFAKDFPLLPYPADLQKIVQIRPLAQHDFCPQDAQNLRDFATTSRSFFSCYASLKRFYHTNPHALPMLDEVFTQTGFTLPEYKKTWVTELKRQILALNLGEITSF